MGERFPPVAKKFGFRGGHTMQRDATRIIEASGGKVIGSVRHPQLLLGGRRHTRRTTRDPPHPEHRLGWQSAALIAAAGCPTE
jgi:hypothetical protein